METEKRRALQTFAMLPAPTKAEAYRLVEQVPLQEVLTALLQPVSQPDVELMCAALEKVFQFDEIANKVLANESLARELFERGSQSSNGTVQKLLSTTLSGVILRGSIHSIPVGLIPEMTRCLGRLVETGEDDTAALLAVKSIEALLLAGHAPQEITPLVARAKEKGLMSEEARVRVLGLCVNLAASDADLFSWIDEQGALNALLDICSDSGDFLLQMVGLELLQQIAASPTGVMWSLEPSRNVPQLLLRHLSENPVLTPSLKSSLLQALESLLEHSREERKREELARAISVFIPDMLQSVDGDNSIEALAGLRGLLTLARATPELIQEQWIESAASLAYGRASSFEMRNASLSCLGGIFESGATITPEFRRRTLEKLVAMASNASLHVDCRPHIFSALRAAITRDAEAAGSLMCANSNFRRMITDRMIDTEPTVRRAKFLFIVAIVDCVLESTLEALGGAKFSNDLKAIAESGPYYSAKSQEAEVATVGA